MKRLVFISITLLVLLPLMLLSWLILTESGLHWAQKQAGAYLPVELTIGKLEGQLLGPITLKNVSYKQDGTLIQAAQITIDWQPTALLLAHVDISRVRIQSLSISLPSSDKSLQNQPLSLPDIHLPWRIALNNAQIDGLSILQNEQRIELNQIKLNASSVFSQLDIKSLEINADNFDITINGNLQASGKYPHKLDIQWQTTLPTKAQISGRGQLSGNVKTTRIQQHLSGPLELRLDGKINDLLKSMNWQAEVDVSTFNTMQLITGGPDLSGALNLQAKGDVNSATITGKLNGKSADIGPFDADFEVQRLIDNSLQINRLMLRSPVSDTLINAHGQWMPDNKSGNIKLALDWQKLRWPLTDGSVFHSENGQGTIDGSLDKYRFNLSTDRPWAQAPPSTWYATAEGNLDGLNVKSLRVTALHGEANATGKLNWSPQLSWQAEINATDINPSALWPQWPGQLKAKLVNRGRIENDRLIIDTEIVNLTGNLRGYPLTANSLFSWKNNALDIHHLELHSATSQLSAKGQVGDALNLHWSIDTKNLAELYPLAQGQLNSSGQLSGPLQAPLIKGVINGKALSLPGYEINDLDANVALDMSTLQQIDIRVMASGLKFKELTLKTLDISADKQTLKAGLSTESANATMSLKGKVDAQVWHGMIESVDIQSPLYDNWQLKNPAVLTISKDILQSDPLCWHNHKQASLCTSVNRQYDNWQSVLQANNLPLKLLHPWLPADLTLAGVVNIGAQLQLQGSNKLTGHAHFRLPPSTINYPLVEGEQDSWEYQASNAEISLDDQGIKTNASLTMSNNDHLLLNADLPGAQLLTLNGQQKVNAQAQLVVRDLGLVEALLPEVQSPKGELALDLTANGTLAHPSLSGNAHLLKGEFRIPRLGLAINKINVNAQSDGIEKIILTLNAHSGEGEITMKSQTSLDKEAGWPTVASIKGKRFEASKIPDAHVMISPDLHIKLQHHEINISGGIDIPYAKLQPKDITTAAQISDDAVIIGGEQATQEKWSVISKVRLTLGEQVSLYGYGFEGRLGGNLLVEDVPGQLTRATGEINIPEGRYRAYGQRLDVEHGRLLYTGGPLTNPGLDIRAVRITNNVTAGIKVKGSLNRPQLELFSIPTMGQTDALAYLLLGRPMESTSGEDGEMMAKAALALSLSGGDYLARTLGDRFGLDEMRVESSDTSEQASLVVGRYLSPKLYISYGVGLIETINTLTVRYSISEKWQLKAESGEYQGADLLYIFDR